MKQIITRIIEGVVVGLALLIVFAGAAEAVEVQTLSVQVGTAVNIGMNDLRVAKELGQFRDLEGMIGDFMDATGGVASTSNVDWVSAGGGVRYDGEGMPASVRARARRLGQTLWSSSERRNTCPSGVVVRPNGETKSSFKFKAQCGYHNKDFSIPKKNDDQANAGDVSDDTNGDNDLDADTNDDEGGVSDDADKSADDGEVSDDEGNGDDSCEGDDCADKSDDEGEKSADADSTDEEGFGEPMFDGREASGGPSETGKRVFANLQDRFGGRFMDYQPSGGRVDEGGVTTNEVGGRFEPDGNTTGWASPDWMLLAAVDWVRFLDLGTIDPYDGLEQLFDGLAVGESAIDFVRDGAPMLGTLFAEAASVDPFLLVVTKGEAGSGTATLLGSEGALSVTLVGGKVLGGSERSYAGWRIVSE